METYRKLNKELTLQNQDLRSTIADYKTQLNILQECMLRARKENAMLKQIVFKEMFIMSTSFNKILAAVNTDENDDSSPMTMRTSGSIKSNRASILDPVRSPRPSSFRATGPGNDENNINVINIARSRGKSLSISLSSKNSKSPLASPNSSDHSADLRFSNFDFNVNVGEPATPTTSKPENNPTRIQNQEYEIPTQENDGELYVLLEEDENDLSTTSLTFDDSVRNNTKQNLIQSRSSSNTSSSMNKTLSVVLESHFGKSIPQTSTPIKSNDRSSELEESYLNDKSSSFVRGTSLSIDQSNKDRSSTVKKTAKKSNKKKLNNSSSIHSPVRKILKRKAAPVSLVEPKINSKLRRK